MRFKNKDTFFSNPHIFFQVDALLKRQEDQFKQRLARASKSTGSKETSQMREEKLELDELRRACVDVTKSR